MRAVIDIDSLFLQLSHHYSVLWAWNE